MQDQPFDVGCLFGERGAYGFIELLLGRIRSGLERARSATGRPKTRRPGGDTDHDHHQSRGCAEDSRAATLVRTTLARDHLIHAHELGGGRDRLVQKLLQAHAVTSSVYWRAA